MFRALVTCPDNECAEAFDAVAELEQLEALICDCGCTLRIERVSEHETDGELARGEFELTLLA
jgi:hypothetical protein